MTQQVLRKAAAFFPEFDAQVRKHAEEMTAHAAHMALVEESQEAGREVERLEAEEGGITADVGRANERGDHGAVQRLTARLGEVRQNKVRARARSAAYAAYPAPFADPLVAASVSRRGDGSFAPDYELVDALPVTPGDEAALRARREELTHVVSGLQLEALDALLPRGKWAAYGFRYSDIAKADAARRLKLIESGVPNAELDHRVRTSRATEDDAFYREHAARMEAVERIHRHTALLHSQIEDLTAADAHGWTPAPFPK